MRAKGRTDGGLMERGRERKKKREKERKKEGKKERKKEREGRKKKREKKGKKEGKNERKEREKERKIEGNIPHTLSLLPSLSRPWKEETAPHICTHYSISKTVRTSAHTHTHETALQLTNPLLLA